MIEVDGVRAPEVDKLNGIYKVNGNDMLAGVNSTGITRKTEHGPGLRWAVFFKTNDS